MKRSLFSFFLLFLALDLVRAGTIDRPIEEILEHYFRIHSALTRDSTEGVDEAAAKIAALASGILSSEVSHQRVLDRIKESAELIQGKELKEVRQQFFELSKSIQDYLKQSYTGKKTYLHYYCSMEKKSWIQAEEGAQNPYYGKAMLACGERLP